MNVLIAGRTKMFGTGRCIGGLLDNGKPVRLLRPGGHHWDTTASFQIGENWDVSFSAAPARPAPHSEDRVVTGANLIGIQPDLQPRLLALTKPFEGSISKVFGGLLGFTANGNGYISQSRGVPQNSTGFWIPNRDLTLRDDGLHYDYVQGFFRGGAQICRRA